MSSRVAAYFPDALAKPVEVRGGARDQSEVPKAVGDAVEHTSDVIKTLEASDEMLMERLREETKEAFAILFRRYARLVRAIAYRIVKDESEADDLVQEIFLFIFRKANLFDPDRGSARSWIVQITYHRAIDRRRYLAARHFYNRAELDDTLGQAEKNRSQDDLYERSAEGILGREKMRQLVELLSADQQRVLDLYFYEGYTLEEVAQTMQQSIGNIRNHYYRGLEKLRRGVFEGKLKSK